MHGSLLPQYRGRAPVNWAVIHGETRDRRHPAPHERAKPDNGYIVDQTAVPILIDDTAHEVFGKVVVAAENVLARSLPADARRDRRRAPAGPLAGPLLRRPQAGGRSDPGQRQRPADPQPGARPGAPSTRAPSPSSTASASDRQHPLRRTAAARYPRAGLGLASEAGALWLLAADGSTLEVLAAQGPAGAIDAAGFERRFGAPRAGPPLNHPQPTDRPMLKGPHPRRQWLHWPPPHPPHPGNHRLGGLRHGHGYDRLGDLVSHPRMHFFEGDITINKEWIEYNITQVRRSAAAGGHRHPGHLRASPAARVRARFRGQPADGPAGP